MRALPVTITRPRPGPAVCLVVIVAYAVVAIGIQLASGVPYDEWFDTTAKVVSAPLPAFLAGAVLLLSFARWSRWDGLWRDPHRISMPAWAWFPVVLTLLVTLLVAADVSWGTVPGSLLAAVVVTTALIGLCEELLFRGIVLRGLREGTPEAVSAVVMSLLFGLFHLVNLALAAPFAQTVVQVISAFFAGFSYYLMRRGTRLLAIPIVVHAIFDLSVSLAPDSAGAAGQLGAALNLPIWLVTLVVMVALLLRDDERSTPVDRSARGPVPPLPHG